MLGRTDYQAAELSNKYLLKYIQTVVESVNKTKTLPPNQEQNALKSQNP